MIGMMAEDLDDMMVDIKIDMSVHMICIILVEVVMVVVVEAEVSERNVKIKYYH